MSGFVDSTQKLGRSVMLAIAVLPVAGLLLRFGQPDLLDLKFVAAAGDAIFSHLGILFAIGVAVGLARENHGAAGLAGVVGYLVTTRGIEVVAELPPGDVAKLGVPVGIVSGVIAGWLYNRYADIRLPAYLAFFGGRRFVPIASGTVALLVAAVLGLAWPTLVAAIDAFSHAVTTSGGIGLFVYGVLNRVLIVTGLHHILNNVAWFIVGDYGGVTGDLKRFFAGDPTAGAFMSGFFPVMVFGLPAACLAMYRSALPERRKAVGGMLLSLALTSLLTGVTEPIEFSFMFLAPVLYALHAVLTGLAMATMDALGVRLGFSFSAGLIDFVLNLDKAERPWMLLPVGAVYFALYYGLFRWFIVRFDLRTPGREAEGEVRALPAVATADGPAGAFVAALGGAGNVRAIDACTTRIRLELADRTRVDEARLKDLGARGAIAVGTHGLQVVMGPIADQLASDIRAVLARQGAMTAASVEAGALRQTTPTDDVALPDATRLLAALGSAANIERTELANGRLLVTVRDAARVDDAALRPNLRGVARPTPSSLHLLHPDPAGLQALLT